MYLIGEAFWQMSIDMGIYILFGLLAAGVLHQLISETWIQKHLGSNTHGSVYKAALFGTPLPLCSCSVIPFAASIRRNGASKGSTLSFLISTPITGIDSILATFGMFGWVFTLYRVFTSVIIAIAAGMIMNRFEPKEVAPKGFAFSAVAPQNSPKIVQTFQNGAHRKSFSFTGIFHYGFGTLLGSFSKPLFWGLLIGAFISAAIPSNLSELFNDNRMLGYFIAVAIAAPMYVCATASLPIAASLMIAGVSPGAAFIFLSAGPATNTVTMGVVKSMLGSRALAIYLGVIVIGSILFGSAIDFLFDSLSMTMTIDLHEHHGLLEEGAAVLMLGLIAWHLIRERFEKKKSCGGGSCCS